LGYSLGDLGHFQEIGGHEAVLEVLFGRFLNLVALPGGGSMPLLGVGVAEVFRCLLLGGGVVFSFLARD